MREITRQSILRAAKKVAKKGAPVSRGGFTRQTGISAYFIMRHFPDGGWDEVQRLANLPKHRGYRRRVPDEELMRTFHQAASELGEIPTGAQLQARGAPCRTTYNKRFGPLPQFLRRYETWLLKHEPKSPLLAKLKTIDKSERIVRARKSHAARNQKGSPASPPPTEWPKRQGVEFGAPLNFRGLRHAPTNELGVIYLFGMISDQLGMVVDSLQPGFPDCEAKRCIDASRGRWQRVRIEFEFQSHNFRDHQHDPKHCDMIVCWVHDWVDCPLEVLELRAVVAELASGVGTREETKGSTPRQASNTAIADGNHALDPGQARCGAIDVRRGRV